MLEKGKALEGHSAGARGNKLAAYAAMGVSSCHESTIAQDVLERLRLGLYAMAREGSIRCELKAISGILDHDISLRRLILSTDGIFPSDLPRDRRGGKLQIPARSHAYSPKNLDTIRLPTRGI